MISLKEKNNQNKNSLKENLKQFWNWIWNSESIWSYLVFLILIFIIVKFIFLPGLSLAFGQGLNGLPLAIVESSSMEHYSLKYCTSVDSSGVCNGYSNNYDLCGNSFQEQKFFSKNEYWQYCGKWYQDNTNITKEQFQSSSFSNGFRKGDIMVIWGWKKPQIGDVIVFNAGRNHPIIHRLIKEDNQIFQTKGDHNAGQLISNNNGAGTDETNITQDKIIGTAVLRIPYLGWIKLFFAELLQKV